MALLAHTIAQWRAELTTGHGSARELIEQALDGVLQGSEAPATFLEVHAVAARACADAIDRQREAGVPLPALAGIQIGRASCRERVCLAV